jgi:hypothetical protein
MDAPTVMALALAPNASNRTVTRITDTSFFMIAYPFHYLISAHAHIIIETIIHPPGEANQALKQLHLNMIL